MALDPLKFQVAIQDDATSQLSSIEAALNSLKDKTISVKVEGLSDLQNLLSALQHQQVSNLGKDVGNAINEASRNLQKEAQDAVRTSLGNLAQDLASIKTAIQNDNFTAFSNRIQTCAEKVNLLDEAFKKFKVTIGENEELKNLLTGLGAAIREVSSAMSAMNSVKNGGGGAKAAQKEELKQQEEGLIKLANAIGRVRDAASGGGGASSGSVAFMESINKVGERNIQTLIKEQGHIERLIAIAKKSIDFGEGHPVLGMGRLRGDQMQNLQNLEQLKNIIKEILFAAHQGDQSAIRFLNTLDSLKIVSFGKDLMGNNITLLGGHFDQLTHSVTGTATAMRQLNKDMRIDFNKVANKEKLAAEAEAVKKLAASYKSMQQESKTMRSQSESALASRIKMLREQSADLQKLLSVGKIGLGEGQYNSVRDALREIRKELQQIETITQRGGNSTGLLRSLSVGRDYSGVIASGRAVADMRNKQAQETNLASRAVSQLTMEEQRLAQALNQATNSARGQSQVLSDLKSMATQYLGVWGAQQFIHNIIQIGGQLEQQRLSIGAILGDMAAGQHLFDQIKQLALVSPFGVVELDKYTKQLSAYGFKQSELFGMTKRLADISAGAGTEVSRLALALGHVRSEGALTGYTLRQFAMNNIPMLQKLSERLTKIEGQIVSTSEIRKRVSKKEIGYEDVIAVIKDLTNEGGMFFNMQETMADAVNAKFKNLKDSMDIMYGEMAEGGIGTALKKVAETLMFLTRNWEETARVIGYGTAAFVMYRIAVASANTQLMTYGSTLGVTAKSLNAKSIALGVASASVKRLTASEVDEMVTLKLVTREQLLNAVATKTLTVDQAELAAATFGVTRAELSSIASKGKLGIATTGLGLRIRSLILSLRGVGVALKSMFLNPVGIALMTITGAFEVFMRWKQKNEEIAQSIEQLGKKGSEGYKNLASTLEKYSGKDGKMSDSEYSTAITDITDMLKNYAPNITNIQKEAQSIDDLAKRYEYLRGELESTRNAYADLERTKSFASNANESTGNLLNDTFTENVEDYIGNVHKVDKAEQELMQHRISLEKSLDELERKTSFKRRTDESGNVLPLIEQLKYIRNTDLNRLFSPILFSNSQGASSSLADYVKALSQMEEKMLNEVMPDLQNFAARLNNQYSGIFGKDWKNNADHIKTAWMAVVSEIDKVPGMTDNVRKDLLEKIFNETWHLNIDFSTGEVTESLTGWRKEMQDWIDEHDLRFRIGFNDSREDIYKKAKAAQEAAQAEMNNAGNVLINIGFKLNNLPQELPSVLRTPWNQQNFEDYVEQKAVNDSWEEFKKRFGTNWDSKNKTGSKKTGKSEDKDARRLREIVKLYKDAYDWYGKYEKQVGEGSALAKVKEQFQPLFDEFRNQWKQSLSLDSIPEYKQNLETLLSEAQKLYESPKHKNSYMVEAIKTIRDAINNVDYEEAQRKMDEYASKVQIELDGLTRAWDMFNNVREATGNIDLAVQLSGADYQAGQTRNLADSLKKKIEKDFASANAVAIPFDINMSDKDIENKIKAAIPKESEERIKGIVEEYKKWRDLQRDVVKTDISTFAQLLGSAQDYETSVAKINNNLAIQKEAIDAIEKPKDFKGTDEEWEKWKAIAKAIAEANAERDIFKLSSEYINLMNNSLAMTSKEIEYAARSVETELNRRLQAGTISAQEFATEMEKVHKIVRDTKLNSFFGKNTAFTNFLNGGVNGAVNWLDQAINKRIVELGKSYTTGKDGKYNGTDQTLIDLLNKRAFWEKLQQSLKHVALAGEIVTGAFDGMVQAAQSLSEMFDALGNEAAANTWSDISDAINGISSVFKPVNNLVSNAMNGNIGGIASSAFSAPVDILTGPITAFARLHDKALQREIEKLREDVQKIENNTDLIVQARERTLGYDNGDLRRSYAQQYAPNEARHQKLLASEEWFYRALANTTFGQGFNSVAQKTMYEYYQRNSAGTGYQQQLANLKAEREDYMRMYNAENDKKKSSGEALEEYRKKIAEIDDQILYFTEDLAKELWGIDLKGWANQISDSLWTAFENGEDAIKAFHETAKDIISDVAKRMMNIHLIEPVMTKLEEALFGKVGANGERIGGGAYNMQTGKFNERETLEILGQFFGEGGEFAKVIGSAESFYEMAKKVTGIDFGSDSGGSTSSTIKGVTEQTADLLASYVNAIRADVSVIRAMIAQYFPQYYQVLTSGNERLRGIENNTAAIMRSNEAIEKSNQAILDRIDGLRNNTWRVPMA